MISTKDVSYIYCINLERRKDRKVKMEEMFSKIFPSIPVHFIQAVDGLKHGIHPRKACGMSHINAITLAKAAKLPNVLICEDDIEFSSNSTYHLRRAIKHINNKGILSLGTYCIYGEPIPTAAQTQHGVFCVNGHSITGTMALYYTSSVYDIVINSITKGIEKNDKIHIDGGIFGQLSKRNIIKYNLVWPMIIKETGSFSDNIRSSNMDLNTTTTTLNRIRDKKLWWDSFGTPQKLSPRHSTTVLPRRASNKVNNQIFAFAV